MVGSGAESSMLGSMTVSSSSVSGSGSAGVSTGSGSAGRSSFAQRFLTISQPYIKSMPAVARMMSSKPIYLLSDSVVMHMNAPKRLRKQAFCGLGRPKA